MRHAAIQREPELFAPDPIAPWSYIRMRRRAAGLTIEEAAKPFYKRDEHRADVENNLRTFETPGVRVKAIRDLDLPRAFPFDPAIYEQLADTPAEQHPQLCVRCGWDEWTDQHDREGYATAWSEALPGHCTRCEQDARRAGKLA